METLKCFTEDLQIAQSILKRDGKITRYYLYKKCYPMFKSIYDNYHTDSLKVREFIDDIYLLIMTPSKETGRCQLENYRGESTLMTWIKTVCLFHCYHRYERKKRIPVVELVTAENDDDDDSNDRLIDNSYSTTIDTASIERSDMETIIGMMPNERYQNIIRLRYLDNKSNEETAEALNMSMANYYNKHKLAKEQFVNILRKESQHV